MEYDTARYPPRLCPSSIMDSKPTWALHCSTDSTNWSSASWASEENIGLLLWPKPSRSRAKTGRCWDRASRFWAQMATPLPNPWRRTIGVLFFTQSLLKVRVHSRLPLEMGTCCLEKALSTSVEGRGEQRNKADKEKLNWFVGLDRFFRKACTWQDSDVRQTVNSLHLNILSSALCSWLWEVGHHDGSQLGIQHHLHMQKTQWAALSPLRTTERTWWPHGACDSETNIATVEYQLKAAHDSVRTESSIYCDLYISCSVLQRVLP